MKKSMTTKTLVVLTLIGLILVLVSCKSSPEIQGPNPLSRISEGMVLGPGDFQSFVKNWDTINAPILMVKIQNTLDWDTYFSPATIGGSSKPFGPPAEDFLNHDILVVAGIQTLDANTPSAPSPVPRLEAIDKNLSLSFELPDSIPREGGYETKWYFGVWVKRGTYESITIIATQGDSEPRVLGSL